MILLIYENIFLVSGKINASFYNISHHSPEL